MFANVQCNVLVDDMVAALNKREQLLKVCDRHYFIPCKSGGVCELSDGTVTAHVWK